VSKLGFHLGINEFLNIRTISRSHAGENRPLQLIVDEVTNINLLLASRLAPIEEVDMIAMALRSVPLLEHQVLTEKLGQIIVEVVHA
jgi:hypothetical protein